MGFVSALIAKDAQFRSADVSVSSPIDVTVQGSIAVNSIPVEGSEGLLDEALHYALPAATGESPPPYPGTGDLAGSTALYEANPAPFTAPPQPTAALEFGTNPNLTSFGPNAPVGDAVPLLSSSLAAGNSLVLDLDLTLYAAPTSSQNKAVVLDLNMNLYAVSPESQYTGPTVGPIVPHDDLLDLSLVRLVTPGAYAESEEYFPQQPPPPMFPNWTMPKVQISQEDINYISDPDISVLGSLMSVDSHGSTSALMMEASTGRGSGSGFGFGLISTGLSTQIDLGADSNGNGWMSYVATDGSVVSGAQTSVARSDVVPAPDETGTEPSTPASITTGEVPLSILLSGPDAQAQAGSDRLEQVAELMPIEESSLAMVATLWTVSSDSQTTPPQSDVELTGVKREPDAASAAPPSWTVFVTGLDEAFEQSRRDVEQGFFSRPGRPVEGTRARGALDEGLPWQGPILPASDQGSFDRATQGDRTGRSTTADESTLGECRVSSRHAGDAESQSDEGRAVVVASLPTISAVSAFSVIAGWLWTQRERWQRFRPGRRSSKGL